MKKISLMISPTDQCNINCAYCYNRPRRIKNGTKVISKEIINHTLKLVSEYVEVPEVQLVWHGGEPTVLGVEWFEEVQPLIFENSGKCIWNQGMQTNSTLLDDRWMQFIKKHNISISTSYDVFSQDVRDKESDVWGKIQLMLKNGVRPGLLTSVNAENYTRLIDMYEYYKSHNIGGFCFNTVYILEDAPEEAQKLKLNPMEYIKEWEKYLKYWLNDFSDWIIFERSIREGLAIVLSSIDLPCGSRDCHTEYLTVNCNGEITTCNRHCPEEYILGNIMDYKSIEKIYSSRGFFDYKNVIAFRKMTKCGKCDYAPYCRGGCKLNHLLRKSGFDTDVCETFKGTFDTVYRNLREIDLEAGKLNHILFSLISTQKFFTVSEIRSFLHSIGYSGEIGYDNDDILNSTEFKLFKVFNVGVSDMLIHRIPLKRYTPNIFKDTGFMAARRCSLMNIYRENALRIKQILTT